MAWFFIEAAVALAVGIAIVWWTMAPQRKLRSRASNELPTAVPKGLPEDAAAKSDAAPKVD